MSQSQGDNIFTIDTLWGMGNTLLLQKENALVFWRQESRSEKLVKDWQKVQ